MSRFWPTTGEAESLRFLISGLPLRRRVGIAAVLFAAGLVIWGLAPFFVGGIVPVAPAGLVLVLAGHLFLWVRTQTTAPGGATPAHEEMWAPADDDWSSRLAELEEAGKRWDATPWDVTNLRGCATFLGVAAAAGFAVFIIGTLLGADAWVRLVAGAALLLLPIWFNGIRTTWNPSELRLKGESLETARKEAAGLVEGDFDIVPLLAFREGKKGKYPVDAKLMLRPKEDDGSGFLGIQVQVAMNNVKGRDYPYLYCVVLGKEGFRLERPRGGARLKGPGKRQGRRIVFERGRGDGAEFLVVRQHADRQGGWHTKELAIGGLVQVAVAEGRKAWEENRK